MPAELAPRDGQVAPRRRTRGEHDRVELLVELVDRDVDADLDCGTKLGALASHLLEPALEEPLLHLELGDAVAEEPADAIGALEHDHAVPGAAELLCRREPRGPRTDDGDALASQRRGRLRHDPALIPRAVDDLDLDLLDRHRIAVDPEHARRFARCGAQPARELGEVVRRVKALDRLAPALAVHEVVPVGDEVAERAAVVAERDAAVHAPPRLMAQLVLGEGLVHLVPVAQAHGHRPTGRPDT